MHLNKHGSPSVSGGIMDMVLVVGSSPTMEFFAVKFFSHQGQYIAQNFTTFMFIHVVA